MSNTVRRDSFDQYHRRRPSHHNEMKSIDTFLTDEEAKDYNMAKVNRAKSRLHLNPFRLEEETSSSHQNHE
jgi:hypothetical protein